MTKAERLREATSQCSCPSCRAQLAELAAKFDPRKPLTDLGVKLLAYGHSITEGR
jgi:hypothetical protein